MRLPQGERRAKLSDYLLDVSKFLVGGAIIGNIFSGAGTYAMFAASGFAVFFGLLGLYLTKE